MKDFAKQLNQSLQQMYDKASSCKEGLLSQVAIDRGLRLLESLDYPHVLLKDLPPGSDGLAFPCANPLPRIVSLKPHTILDLGCGTALDALFCARSLPRLHRLTGLDTSSKLLAKGKKLLHHFPDEASKITLLQADFNHLSNYQFDSSELILMNGSFNLIYDKAEFLVDLAPLLTDNGTLLIYDFILTEDLPPEFSDDVDNWLWNIGGALNLTDLEGIIRDAGLAVVEINELERIDPVARCEIIISHEKRGNQPIN